MLLEIPQTVQGKRQRGWGMLLEIPQTVQGKRQRGWGMLLEIPQTVQAWGVFVRLLGKLLLNPINIPLRRFAFATRRCPPSKGDVGLAKAIGGDVVFRTHRHLPAAPNRK